MLTIYQLYEKLLTCLRIKSNKKSTLLPFEHPIGSINFTVSSNSEIDMLCGLPSNLEDKDPDEIAVLAEQYANLLLTITTGELNEPIFKFLKSYIKKTQKTNEVLFVDNVILFWSFLHKEKLKKKSKKNDQNQPVIRPSQVFPH
jgi:hypothetical protein